MIQQFVLFFLILFGLAANSFAQIEIQNDQISSHQILENAKIYLDTNQAVKDHDGGALTEILRSIQNLPSIGLNEINGYKNSKIWMVFALKNTSNKPPNSTFETTDFFIRYAYPSMQYIGALIYDENGNLNSKMSSGKLVPFAQRPVKDTDYLFPIKLEKNKPVTVVMSFQSSGSMQLPIEILSVNKVHELTQTKYLIYGLYYGVIFLVLLYTLFLAMTIRGQLYHSYLFYILSVVFAQMGLHGISYRYLWPEFYAWNKVSTIFFVGLMFCSLSVFSVLALDLKKNHKRFFLMMSVFSAVSVMISVSALFAYGAWLIRFTGIMTSLLPLVIIPPGIVALKKGNKFAKYYLAAVVFYIIGASLYGLKDAGILRPTFLTENGILLGSLLEISIFSLGIAQHIQAMQKKSEQLKIELERANIMA